MLLARTAGDAAALAADIDRELRPSEPDSVFTSEAGTFRGTADVTVLPFRVAASVACASGVVAAVLRVISLYGVIALLVVRRRAIRPFGPHRPPAPAVLHRHVLAPGGWMVALGLGSGSPLALFLMRVFAQIAACAPTSDPVTWATVPPLLFVVCAVAFGVAARRTVRLDVSRTLQWTVMPPPRACAAGTNRDDVPSSGTSRRPTPVPRPRAGPHPFSRRRCPPTSPALGIGGSIVEIE